MLVVCYTFIRNCITVWETVKYVNNNTPKKTKEKLLEIVLSGLSFTKSLYTHKIKSGGSIF
jgi:hypothetical protein